MASSDAERESFDEPGQLRYEAADFRELKDALKTTQGNLSIHLRKLEDAGYVAIDKSFLNRKPLTRARLRQVFSINA